MSKDQNFIQGMCSSMCPIKEVNLRKERNLVHFYEKNGKCFVKEFSRSAADKRIESPENLRTFEALKNTLEYLFKTWVYEQSLFHS